MVRHMCPFDLQHCTPNLPVYEMVQLQLLLPHVYYVDYCDALHLMPNKMDKEITMAFNLIENTVTFTKHEM